MEEIIKKAFDENVQIIDIIKLGLRCETYVVKVKEEKYIFQIYLENAIYQAKKKYDILKKIDNKLVPKAIKFKESKEYAYLITEYMDGKSLYYYRKADSQFSSKDILWELAKFLGQIHSITNKNIYGWIDNIGVKKKNTFIDYIKSEYNRLIINFENLNFEIKENILRKVNNAIEIINEKSANIKKSCLCWYDINPGNLLITKQEKSYKLNALIDPGGARWGVPEWDIAFIKMQLCNTQEEFLYFLEKYKNENPQIKIDIELVNALSIIVEFDVMEFELSKNIIILPIPFDTNFKREFEAIHKHIKMENERLKFTY